MNTYAVFNQVRTVSATRFIAVKGEGGRLNISMDKTVIQKLYTLLLHDILYNLGQDDKISILKSAYDKECFNKAKDMAYKIIRLRKSGTDEAEIVALKTSIRQTLNGVSYILDAVQKADGIKEIFDEAD